MSIVYLHLLPLQQGVSIEMYPECLKECPVPGTASVGFASAHTCPLPQGPSEPHQVQGKCSRGLTPGWGFTCSHALAWLLPFPVLLLLLFVLSVLVSPGSISLINHFPQVFVPLLGDSNVRWGQQTFSIKGEIINT